MLKFVQNCLQQPEIQTDKWKEKMKLSLWLSTMLIRHKGIVLHILFLNIR
jgi:hypothetical protein